MKMNKMKLLSIILACSMLATALPITGIASDSGAEVVEAPASITEEPKQEEPKQEEPKQEESKQEESKQEESKQEESKQEESKQEESKQEESKQDEGNQASSSSVPSNSEDQDPADVSKSDPQNTSEEQTQSISEEVNKTEEKQQEVPAAKKSAKKGGPLRADPSGDEKTKVTLTWGTNEFTYTGSAQHPQATTTPSGVGISYTGNVDDAIEVGDNYSITAVLTDTENYEFEDPDQASIGFSITKKTVALTWSPNPSEFTYNGSVQQPEAEPVGVTLANPLGYEGNTTAKDAGNYSVTAKLSQADQAHYVLDENTKACSFEIKPVEVDPIFFMNNTSTETDVFSCEYDNKEHQLYIGFKKVDGTSELAVCEYTHESVEKEFVDAETYTVTANSTGDTNYVWKDGAPEQDYTIKKSKLRITIRTNQQYKRYGENDPLFKCGIDFYAYGEIIQEEQIEAETNGKKWITYYYLVRDDESKDITASFKLSRRDNDENVGKKYICFEDFESNNYELDSEVTDGEFDIFPLDIKVSFGEYEKEFGANDPEKIQEECKIIIGWTPGERKEYLDNGGYDEDALRKELTKDGKLLYKRNEGELPGDYEITINEEVFNNNFHVIEEKGKLTINKMKNLTAKSVNSRQKSITIELPEGFDKKVLEDLEVRLKVAEFELKKDSRFGYTKTEADYFKNSEILDEGIEFTETVDLKTVTYTLLNSEKKKIKACPEWAGYLPAGSKISFVLVAEDEYGNTVNVSEDSKEITVAQAKVDSPSWSGATIVDGEKQLLREPGSLTVTGASGEVLLVDYQGTHYGKTDWKGTPISIRNGYPESQVASAKYVDELNLIQAPATYTFIYDDAALPISSCQYENRGSTIRIVLQEEGMITAVDIPNGTVTLTNNWGTEHVLNVSFSGYNLITTGSPITVKYKDKAGHETTGSFTTARSTVSTPITLQIRPALNANGFLNGQATSLIVSGSGCRCEPIRITVADMSTSTYISQTATWSDSNGTWEAVFDLTRLPDRTNFTITAEYLDVNGPGATMSVQYDSFCAQADVVSPVFEAMSFVSGMAEPATAVVLVYDGKAYEAKVDRFGHFVLYDVPSMFAGIDSFDIYVTDIAGNVAIRHYEIPEPGDPFVTTSELAPLGKFFFSAEREDPYTVVATPVTLSDLKEDGKLELPLLVGASYVAGTVTVEKTGSGVKLTRAIDEELKDTDYTISNERLHVFTSKPEIKDLRSRNGSKEYAYGDEIPLSGDSTIWIADDSNIEILAESLMDLDILDFELDEIYPVYQER